MSQRLLVVRIHQKKYWKCSCRFRWIIISRWVAARNFRWNFLYPFRRVPPRESSANVGHCLDDPRSESTPTHFRYFSAAGETLSNTRLSKPLKTNAQVTQCLFAHTQNVSPPFRSPSKYISKHNRHGQEKSRKKKNLLNKKKDVWLHESCDSQSCISLLLPY